MKVEVDAISGEVVEANRDIWQIALDYKGFHRALSRDDV